MVIRFHANGYEAVRATEVSHAKYFRAEVVFLLLLL